MADRALVGPDQAHRARWFDLPAEVAYQVLALRAAVFVAEQACAYVDPDGRDLEPTAEHRWVADPAGVAAYLRVVDDGGVPGGRGPLPGARSIGRVVTRPDRRGEGLAGRLVAGVVADAGAGVLTLQAQSHLVDWYARFGFRPEGPEYVDDGIPHTPMWRGSAAAVLRG